MRKCILHVTDQEYAEILQLNHDALVWSTQDAALMEGLTHIVGPDVVEQLQQFDECRMEKDNQLDGQNRVDVDTSQESPTPAFSG